MSTRVLILEQSQVDGLRRTMRRLFTEQRMNGDDMRDAAQMIESCLRYETGLDDADWFPAEAHYHKAIPALTETWGWTHCVAPGRCDGGAHGNIVNTERCLCGFARSIEINGGHETAEEWHP